MSKLVLFGAGRIGRSFIGQLFSRSGYEVVFIDVDSKLVAELNLRREYKVIIKDEKEDVIIVKNVRALHSSEVEKIIGELVSSGFIAISVGQTNLPKVLPLIAEAFKRRIQDNPLAILDIIVAENMRNASAYMKAALMKLLPGNFPVENRIGIVETSIGKMVPFMREEISKQDPLIVYAEAYNTLILDKQGFRGPLPEVEGISLKENMKAWVDRKSFIHNLGHAAIAYLGYIFDTTLVYTWEVLEIPAMYIEVREVMLESAKVLQRFYPLDFTMHDLELHIDDLLHRFRNRYLGDTLLRVGCDLQRKLGPDDRLVGILLMGFRLGMPVEKILRVIVAGIYFCANRPENDEFPADKEFHAEYKHDLKRILVEVCKLDPMEHALLIETAKLINEEIKLLDTVRIISVQK